MSKLVENYLLQEPIGKGVYGQVFRAVHQKTKEVFAVKVIPKASFRANPKLEQLAINEINILSSLKHENIVRFVETLKTPNNFYFVYEYCNDGTIEGLIAKKKFLKQDEALVIFRQLLEAFKELNKNNIMHRDLKPDNIFLSNGNVKLGDFGFCKMLEVNMAQTMLGSPIYMAPEILKEEIYTSKADIWSLGVVLFELLFGYCPFESSSISQLISVIKENDLAIPKDVNPISEKTETLLRKMLVKDQFKRIEWVDLFEFKIDERGHIVEGYRKEMGFEAIERYFLNDVKSTGEILFGEEPPNAKKPHSASIEEAPSSPLAANFKPQNDSSHADNEGSDSDYPSALKKVTSVAQPSSLLMSESLGKAGPGPLSYRNQVTEFSYPKESPTQKTPPFEAQKDSTEKQDFISEVPKMSRNRSSGSENAYLFTEQQRHKQSLPPSSFAEIHRTWTGVVSTINDLSQRATVDCDKCLYWLCKSLLSKMTSEYSRFPEWTDVIMQEKEGIADLLKELEYTEVRKEADKKNELFKLWSKDEIKGDRLWEQAVRFIFVEEDSENKTVDEILLS